MCGRNDLREREGRLTAQPVGIYKDRVVWVAFIVKVVYLGYSQRAIQRGRAELAARFLSMGGFGRCKQEVHRIREEGVRGILVISTWSIHDQDLWGTLMSINIYIIFRKTINRNSLGLLCWSPIACELFCRRVGRCFKGLDGTLMCFQTYPLPRATSEIDRDQTFSAWDDRPGLSLSLVRSFASLLVPPARKDPRNVIGHLSMMFKSINNACGTNHFGGYTPIWCTLESIRQGNQTSLNCPQKCEKTAAW